MKANLQKAGAGKLTCRLCKGAHFTAKCPYKDSLAGLDGAQLEAPPAGDDDEAPAPTAAPAAASGPRKYVPPSMREGARGAGESMNRPGGNRDDLPTLRVTNISEDAQEQDLRDLFGTFGRVARVYVGRDRETGIGKGFAFISYEDRTHAQKAMEKMHGRGYDSLILNVQWSRKYYGIALRKMPLITVFRATARAALTGALVVVDVILTVHYLVSCALHVHQCIILVRSRSNVQSKEVVRCAVSDLSITSLTKYC